MRAALAQRNAKLLEYLTYMHQSISDLYQLLDQNPLKLIELLETRATIEESPTNLSRLLFSLAVMKNVIDELRICCIEAHRWSFTSRAVSIEEDWDIRGSVVWSLTIPKLCRCEPPTQVVLSTSLLSPENLLLKSCVCMAKQLLTSISVALQEALSKAQLRTSGVDIELAGKQVIQHVNNELSKKLRSVEKQPLIKLLPNIRNPARSLKRLTYELHLRKYRVRWIERLLRISKELLALEDITKSVVDALIHRGFTYVTLSRAIKFYSWRLYEIYVLKLVMNVLKSMFPLVRVRCRGRKFLIELYADRISGISVLYNIPPRSEGVPSRVGDGEAQGVLKDSLPRDILEHSAGRPDITIIKYTDRDKRVIVIETKFSTSPSYLTQARFKLLAYMYEYRTNLGILAFPGVICSRGAFEEEEEETVRLLKEAIRRGGVELTLLNGAKAYLLPIEPTRRSERKNIEILWRVLQVLK